ncbi:hypothetical protein EG68_07239 [Paragonimus skrjabini miyazakii]|uniref:B30.2/SPRY domain-containing protein n=1 Tax=Paragonimus skrjabini miyazakii TaxID=59628 RepID=A0A8S9YTJ3_9TREM|nr:hypothetical protein EG68_07239 [Paragonimus skrjabini miyazakii]
MIGVGLSSAAVPHYTHEFRSAIGLDDTSWGLSYRGVLVHAGQEAANAAHALSFRRGSIVGCLLDLWHGSLQFFVDEYTDIEMQFKGLPRSTYYPLLCSTASRIGFRLIRTAAYPVSLQLLACRAVWYAVRTGKLEPLTALSCLPPQLTKLLKTELPWSLYFSQLHRNRPSYESHRSVWQHSQHLNFFSDDSNDLPIHCGDFEAKRHRMDDDVPEPSDPFLWINFNEPDIQSPQSQSPRLFDDLDDPDSTLSSHGSPTYLDDNSIVVDTYQSGA